MSTLTQHCSQLQQRKTLQRNISMLKHITNHHSFSPACSEPACQEPHKTLLLCDMDKVQSQESGEVTPGWVGRCECELLTQQQQRVRISPCGWGFKTVVFIFFLLPPPPMLSKYPTPLWEYWLSFQNLNSVQTVKRKTCQIVCKGQKILYL